MNATLALAISAGLLLAGPSVGRGQANSTEARIDKAANSGSFCSATSLAQYQACQFEIEDDFFTTKAKCINRIDAGEREDCFRQARRARAQSDRLCGRQLLTRLNICGDLGEARYDPSFDPEDFDDDYHNLTNPHPYFPLTIGYRWTYAGGEETNTIEAIDATKLIEGVRCIVLKDWRYENGLLAEETDDWYGQRKDGTVDFCGEQVQNFETFPGDDPEKPELVSTDGQWKTGREGDPPGHYILGSPTVGQSHRTEFSPSNAEDTVEYLSLAYGYGDDPALDRGVPRALVELFCSAHDCWVTSEVTGIEPGTLQHKFYARDVGLILEVDPRTGENIQLTGCNFDPRCDALSTP